MLLYYIGCTSPEGGRLGFMPDYPILDAIDSLEDYKKLPLSQLSQLADEIRQFLVEHVSVTGGHLASSLGAVELILAMHRVFDSPRDKLVFDVGHQAYAHKIITGRRKDFPALRQRGGISGFPLRSESEHDAFSTGHSSTSISAALGMARAIDLKGCGGTAVALVGDGALTGGMCFEALNDAGQANVPLVVILNDNGMSISPNVGMLRKQLNNMRISKGYVRFKRWLVRRLDVGVFGRWLSVHMENFKNRVKNFLLPHMLFEEMGFVYLGPIDGHDISGLIRYMTRARELHIPVIVHAVTQKGKGYPLSENDPEAFHGVEPVFFGASQNSSVTKKSNSQVFGEALVRFAQADERIVAITAAMPSGTGLAAFAKAYPSRFFDVGIAESHALTMAAGMAAEGFRPVVALYSTFLQRGYDQLLHDICLQRLSVVLMIDRAGLIGADGVTHQGVYDIAFLSTLPHLTIYAPATQQELIHMLFLALTSEEPCAIRYNRGALMQAVSEVPVKKGEWEEIYPIGPHTIVAVGNMVELSVNPAKEAGAGLVSARCLQPMDEKMIERLKKMAKRVVVVEDGIDAFGKALAARLPGLDVCRLHVPDEPIHHAALDEQRALCGLTGADIYCAVTQTI